MPLVIEFSAYLVLSLVIAGLSVLAKNSILVVLVGCALAYAWLWRPRKKFQLVTKPKNIQLYQLLVGVVLSALGAHFWIGIDPLWFQGGLCECLAFFFFIGAFPQASVPSKAALIKSKISKVITKLSKVKKKIKGKQKIKLGLGSWLLIALAVLGTIMEYLFFKDSASGAIFFMILVAGLTVWLARVRNISPENEAGLREEYVIGGILLISALMRFPFIGMNLTGFQIDESNDLLGALDIIHRTVRSPFVTGWSGRATFPFAIFADFFNVLGIHLAVARLFCVIASLFALWFFYQLCRFYFSVTVSAIATLALSFSWWFSWGTFVVFPMMIQALGVLAAFYFMEKGLRDGKRIYFWWSGTFTGITVMTYVWGRTALLLMGAWIVVSYLFTENSETLRKTRLWGLVVWAGGFLWIFGPFIGWLTQNQEFFGRIKELSMIGLVEQTHNYMLPVKTLGYTLISPFITYSADERFLLQGRPLFDRGSSLLLLIGIVLALMTLRKRSSWILLLGLASCIPANALAIQNSSPDPTYLNGQRFFCIVPFVYWGVACAMEWVWAWVGQESKPVQKYWKIFLGLVLAACLAWNVKWLYFDFPNTCNWSRLGYNHVMVADVVRSYSKDREVYLCDEEVASSVVQFLDRDLTFHSISPNDHLVLKDKPTRDSVFILLSWQQPMVVFKNEIMAQFHHAVLKQFNERDGASYLWGIEVPLADLQALPNP